MVVRILADTNVFNWDHKDPADRLLAATAKIEATELWHTDTRLKKLKGFPQRYFVNVSTT
ncbi:MAG: hypothetical protein HS113_18650 [Verrucomicrobiales bacterium]|nr:hypothetical protein [Verrucomicrobiales bacterium]